MTDNVANVPWMHKKRRKVVRGIQDSVLNDKDTFDPKRSAKFAELINARRAYARLVEKYESQRGTDKNTYIFGQIMQGKLIEIRELMEELRPKLVSL